MHSVMTMAKSSLRENPWLNRPAARDSGSQRRATFTYLHPSSAAIMPALCKRVQAVSASGQKLLVWHPGWVTHPGDYADYSSRLRVSELCGILLPPSSDVSIRRASSW